MKLRLSERHRQEREFHDRSTHRQGAHDFYNLGATKHAFQRLLARAGDLAGSRVLDLGCGTGWSSAIYARRGARVVAVDISPKSLEVTKAKIEKDGLGGRVSLQIMAAEQLAFIGESFDYVFGISVLHHTDLSRSVPEISRVLKPSGMAIFIEPLIHNPVIQVYRRLTPGLRTPTERPLSVADIGRMRRVFSRVSREDFYLFSLLAFVWNKLIRSDRLFLAWLERLMKLDGFVLNLFPQLGRYCWSTLVVLEK